MARRRRPAPARKRHPSERFRDDRLFIERWTNAKAALVGQMDGCGLTSVEIARRLGDGTSPETIRRMRKLWQLSSVRGIKIDLTPYETFRLKQKAAKIDLETAEFCRRILATIARDSHDLYTSITDGAFDE